MLSPVSRVLGGSGTKNVCVLSMYLSERSVYHGGLQSAIVFK